MIRVGIKDLRQNLTDYLRKAQNEEDIIITSRDVAIAKLVSIKSKSIRKLQSRAELRDKVVTKGSPLSKIISDLRDER